jgi:hypothetical protein
MGASDGVSTGHNARPCRAKPASLFSPGTPQKHPQLPPVPTCINVYMDSFRQSPPPRLPWCLKGAVEPTVSTIVEMAQDLCYYGSWLSAFAGLESALKGEIDRLTFSHVDRQAFCSCIIRATTLPGGVALCGNTWTTAFGNNLPLDSFDVTFQGQRVLITRIGCFAMVVQPYLDQVRVLENKSL